MTDPENIKGAEDLVARATTHLEQVLRVAFEHEDQAALVVYDQASPLARVLTQAYQRLLPNACFLPFEAEHTDPVQSALEKAAAGELVILIQSTSFRLSAFRIRVELFQRGIKVLEHPHLARMRADEEEFYVDSLAYDPDYYRVVGPALKGLIDQARECVIDSDGALLHYPAGLEAAKLNVGDYREMNNVGGQYPIGEVFTESRDLEAVHGELRVHTFGDRSFLVNRPPAPLTLIVEKGRVIGVRDSTADFDAVLDAIRTDEGQVWLRELGFGMNRAFTPERVVHDIGTYERMCGVHLSLGAKHATYNKPQIRKRSARNHVDVFAVTHAVRLDGKNVFVNGAWAPG